jgi:hypothetical protein
MIKTYLWRCTPSVVPPGIWNDSHTRYYSPDLPARRHAGAEGIGTGAKTLPRSAQPFPRYGYRAKLFPLMKTNGPETRALLIRLRLRITSEEQHGPYAYSRTTFVRAKLFIRDILAVQRSFVSARVALVRPRVTTCLRYITVAGIIVFVPWTLHKCVANMHVWILFCEFSITNGGTGYDVYDETRPAPDYVTRYKSSGPDRMVKPSPRRRPAVCLDVHL